MKNILIVNDDGIQASGIIRLAKAAQKYGKVWVVAPDSQRSGMSHSINLHVGITVYKADFPVKDVEAYSISGTPADCVRLGVRSLLPVKPDLVLSGINFGYNAGTDVMYSGTIGAAMEGIFQGIPSIALSEGTNDGYLITDQYLEEILDEVVPMANSCEHIINVNFPTCKTEELKGILRDRFVSKGLVFDDHYIGTPLEDGGMSYMVAGDMVMRSEEGSDLDALFSNYISIGIVKNLC